MASFDAKYRCQVEDNGSQLESCENYPLAMGSPFEYFLFNAYCYIACDEKCCQCLRKINFHEKVISKLSFIQNWNDASIKDYIYIWKVFFFFLNVRESSFLFSLEDPFFQSF